MKYDINNGMFKIEITYLEHGRPIAHSIRRLTGFMKSLSKFDIFSEECKQAFEELLDLLETGKTKVKKK